MAHFVEYINWKENVETTADAKEAMREIQIVINQTLDSIPFVNGYGIKEIKFDFLSEEAAEKGMQLNLEAKGVAEAKNKEHVNALLQKVVYYSRQPLWNKKIFLEFLYHELNVSETMHEDLNRTLYFNVICAAIIFRSNYEQIQ